MEKDSSWAGVIWLTICSYALIVAGMWFVIDHHNPTLGTVVFCTGWLGVLCIIFYGHVFRFLYGVAVVVGMTAMMVFSVIVDTPRVVFKTLDRIRNKLVRS